MDNNLIKQIKTGFRLLENQQAYTQSDVLKKFITLNRQISSGAFSKILSNKGGGLKILKKCADGMHQIIVSELGLKYDEQEDKFVEMNLPPNWQPKIIPPFEEEKKEERSYIYHEGGRLPIGEKLKFMRAAKEELVEVGVRLNTLSSHFEHRSDQEFKSRITALLERGVDVKLYMLHPDSNEALLYFKDRAKVWLQEDEIQSPEVMKAALKKLKNVAKEYQAANLSGKFEIYLYRHIPYNNFLIVDGNTSNGKMRVSHYMYGIKRANSPVVEITKSNNYSLYKHYWKSYQAFVTGAELVTLD